MGLVSWLLLRVVLMAYVNPLGYDNTDLNDNIPCVVRADIRGETNIQQREKPRTPWAVPKAAAFHNTSRQEERAEQQNGSKARNRETQRQNRNLKKEEQTSVLCRSCKGDMVWSDYAEGDYETDWLCDNFESCGSNRASAGASRWFCEACQSDICASCAPKDDQRQSPVEDVASHTKWLPSPPSSPPPRAQDNSLQNGAEYIENESTSIPRHKRLWPEAAASTSKFRPKSETHVAASNANWRYADASRHNAPWERKAVNLGKRNRDEFETDATVRKKAPWEK